MKTLLVKLLHSLARRVLKKFKPTVIGITGSIGKSATKEAVFAVLARKYRVRKNLGNYNTEIGLPLTILGACAPGRSPVRWLAAFGKGLALNLFGRSYPEMLVLEMGADKPGDIDELLSVVTPRLGVITGIAPVHTEQFGSIAAIAKEKGKLFRAVPKNGWIVANCDDVAVEKLAENAEAHCLHYGVNNTEHADIRAAEIAVSYSNETPTGIRGMSFKIIANGSVTPAVRQGIIGSHQVYPALAAAAVASVFGVHMVDVAEGLRHATVLPGRMRVLPGIKHTILIDDSYNASPEPARAALGATAAIERGDGHLYAVRGGRLELGGLSVEEHRSVGVAVRENGFGVLVTVGERSRDIAYGAEQAGMPRDAIFQFAAPEEAGLFIQQRIQEGDVLLIKGSRGVRMEIITKELMAEPELAGELLVH